ncbi:hypothetical protein [Bradyrhizobium sp. BTAi1]|uniref:hypothetical protein n=1 Tax=Bradyrhizobium sp. (strain BTAi1 / ATCC BAA-1182) TaxID=288000 RepID=UPI00005E0B6F|nr:hypothetical protein [Bradyrhizobium sp. BTAi1]ABQ36961.1 hypothetical protein BBta_4946 [Bradyrhizobium sp. BTAi1]
MAKATKPKTGGPRARASLAPPSIITAMDDPALFEPFFRGESWDGWRAVLKAAYGLPMSDPEHAFFRTVAGDRAPPPDRVREMWCVVGRRGGKDAVASLIAASAAALFDQENRLRPGERALVMCLACDRAQARIILNYIRSYFTDLPLLAGMVTRETAEGFELSNGVDVAVATNSFRAVRGRPILLAVLDEVAFWRDENTAKPDEELYRAITPAMATLSNSMIIGISSPYRKSGLLYKKFKSHFGKDGDVLVIQAPTRTLNPTIPQEIIDRALAEDPAAASAEWMGEFRDDIGGWLPLEVIESAVDQGVMVRPPQPIHIYRSFCDPSGARGDSFTCAIAHEEYGSAVLDCLIEIKPPFNPMEAIGQIARTLREYGLNETTGDRYAAEFNVAAFASCGITYRNSPRDRSAIYQDVLPLFTSGRVRLLDNRRLVSQFAALERHTSSVGRDRIDHGPGGHDDLCNSAAGALITASAADRRPQLLFG